MGLARNSRLHSMVADHESQMEGAYGQTQTRQRDFMELAYGARTWTSTRRCVARLEFGSPGDNPRFVVTNIRAADQDTGQTTQAHRLARRPPAFAQGRNQSWSKNFVHDAGVRREGHPANLTIGPSKYG